MSNQLKLVKTDNRGVAALLTIVIVGAATLIMAYTASILGFGELSMGYTSQKGAETFSIADGCVEEALLRLRIDNNYSGETLSLGEGSCIISVSGAGASRTVVVESSLDVYNKKLQVDITISGSNNEIITIDNWQESEN